MTTWLEQEADILHNYAANFSRVGVAYRHHDYIMDVLAGVAVRWLNERPNGSVQAVVPSQIQVEMVMGRLRALASGLAGVSLSATHGRAVNADGRTVFRADRETPTLYQGLPEPDLLLIGYSAPFLSPDFYTAAANNTRGSSVVAGLPRDDPDNREGHARFKEFCQSTPAHRSYSADSDYVLRYGHAGSWSDLHGRWPADVDG